MRSGGIVGKETYHGWIVQFRRNVHMYRHSLVMAKGETVYTIPCEDSPLGEGLVLMWPYELAIEPPLYQDLLAGLREWARCAGMRYRIYTTESTYETNENEA